MGGGIRGLPSPAQAPHTCRDHRKVTPPNQSPGIPELFADDLWWRGKVSPHAKPAMRAACPALHPHRRCPGPGSLPRRLRPPPAARPLPPPASLTAHPAAVGGVQPEEHLHEGRQLHLQLQPGARLHQDEEGRWPEDRDVRCGGWGRSEAGGAQQPESWVSGPPGRSPGHASRAQKPGRSSRVHEIMTADPPAGPGTERVPRGSPQSRREAPPTMQPRTT